MTDHGLQGSRVLVTGVGCLGVRVIARLVEGGAAEVRAYDRSPGRLLDLPEGVVAIQGDVTDADAVGAAAAGVDVVIHTAAVLDGSVEAQRTVNVAGARTVAEAAAAAGVSRLVHISSNAVYGFCSGVVTEDMGPKPTKQIYSISKSEGEGAVRAVGAATGLPYAIIRPAAIFGPGAEYFTKTFMKRALKKPIVFVGRGRGDQSVIFVDDVADLALLTATHPDAVGEAFNCAIDPPPTMREYQHAYGRLVGNRTWLGIPSLLVQTVSWLAVPFMPRLTYGRQLPRNLRQVERYVTYSGAKAREVLGWEPAYDVDKGVAASLDWLVAEGVVTREQLVGD